MQGLRVSLAVYGQPVQLAPYLVYRSPDIAGEIPAREYKGAIGGYCFGIYCYDADVDVDLIHLNGTVWWGISRYQEE